MINEKITVVIANYNGEEYLPTCLNSLCKIKTSFRVIVVDDASQDNSIKIINSYSKKLKIKLIKNKVNRGAAASRNRAIKKINDGIIVFLDNDTEVDINWLDELVVPLKKKDVGAAQSLIVDFDDRVKIQMAGGRLIRETAWLVPYAQKKQVNVAPKSGIKIAGISASMAVRQDVLSQTGLFDEKEAVTTEDLDLCWRIWIAGYKIVLASRSIVYHHEKTLDKRRNLHVTYTKIYFHLAKNSFRSITKNYEFFNVLLFLPQSIMLNYIRAGIVLVRTRSLSALLGTTRAVVWYLVNLSDTLVARRSVQMSRKSSDKEILNQVFTTESLLDIYRKYYL